jgi:hypothetical protein
MKILAHIETIMKRLVQVPTFPKFMAVSDLKGAGDRIVAVACVATVTCPALGLEWSRDPDDVCSSLQINLVEIRSHEDLVQVATNLPASDAIRLGGEDISDELAISVAARFPKLKHLQLHNTNRLTDAGIAAIGHSFHRLETFWEHEITSPSFTRAAAQHLRSLHNLRNLCFHYDALKLTETIFLDKSMLASWPLLERFGTFNSKVPDGVSYAELLADNFPNLKYFKAIVPDLTTESLRQLERLGNLRYLDLRVHSIPAPGLAMEVFNFEKLEYLRIAAYKDALAALLASFDSRVIKKSLPRNLRRLWCRDQLNPNGGFTIFGWSRKADLPDAPSRYH